MKDKDLGYKKIIEELKSLKKKAISAGIHKDAGTNENDVYIADYAIYNEFGTSTKFYDKTNYKEGIKGRIPARPFLRSTFDEKREEWEKKIENEVNRIIEGKMTATNVIETVGAIMVDDIVEKIDSNVPPPLADSTIKRKGSTRTLVDTGVMKRAIRYNIDEK